MVLASVELLEIILTEDWKQ